MKKNRKKTKRYYKMRNIKHYSEPLESDYETTFEFMQNMKKIYKDSGLGEPNLKHVEHDFFIPRTLIYDMYDHGWKNEELSYTDDEMRQIFRALGKKV
jgi:hypothetical protein